ncbi:ABC transporter permease [Bacillus gaemokensis]|uniref:ABC transporter permease n=1 Tax=Bacillus gaemokensis TaxID=574375 RepID=A0A073KLV5_9BACI|nr:ABC transporter permease [Bacillus gaemokensis]KEK23333.1 ABC transporter permease [Bacillus gaemokensis]KYG37882.1 ABC transporter permease [Bacillus gaemokensis]
MWNILYSEWRSTVREKSAYTFLLLWIVILSLLFLMERNIPSLAGYTNTTGTMLNLILYIIPLFMLIAGSFSIANELENGKWRLLCTYPLATSSYVIGKITGQFMGQIIIFTLSFGSSVMIGLLSGSMLESGWILAIYLFSAILIFFFLVLGIAIGAFSSTRWQGLAISIAIWFLLIMMWPTAIISILNLVPYTMIAPLIKVFMFCNPAELLRIIFVIQLGGGAVFGQPYDQLLMFFQSGEALVVFFVYGAVYTVIFLLIAVWRLERRRNE